ncbi:hypothetical protein GXW71_28220 [Roseomonas hellenica]|uniref:DUF5681 domain-containing protein n=1 Tax=Plastoroseomonas hellenica TaxID=2687306 RepID=A0ABS5F6R4_9PROT|nr:DUF5681 domain-containing protein [Plastoroseomonas hellenica]MBR0668271.1 hypothetical protein [Plastoroseomonas hellenica]
MSDGSTDMKPARPGWQKGQSGNPAGRRKGVRHAAHVALDAIGQESAKDLLRAVVTAALAGDMRAADILLRRLWPERKGRPVEIDLPRIERPADLVPALAAVAEAVAAGELSPEEGQAVAAVLETQRRAAETADLAARIEALEQRSTKE